MSTEQTWEIESSSLENTLEIAEQIGRQLRGGEVIELISDLGGGKTAFVRGLAKGMGSTDTVRSPSFTISNQYTAGELTLYHFDFYRLTEPGIMSNELAEIVNDDKAVIAIEWAEIAAGVIPEAHLVVNIKAPSEDHRIFNFKYPEKLSYLFPSNT